MILLLIKQHFNQYLALKRTHWSISVQNKKRYKGTYNIPIRSKNWNISRYTGILTDVQNTIFLHIWIKYDQKYCSKKSFILNWVCLHQLSKLYLFIFLVILWLLTRLLSDFWFLVELWPLLKMEKKQAYACHLRSLSRRLHYPDKT